MNSFTKMTKIFSMIITLVIARKKTWCITWRPIKFSIIIFQSSWPWKVCCSYTMKSNLLFRHKITWSTTDYKTESLTKDNIIILLGQLAVIRYTSTWYYIINCYFISVILVISMCVALCFVLLCHVSVCVCVFFPNTSIHIKIQI